MVAERAQRMPFCRGALCVQVSGIALRIDEHPLDAERPAVAAAQLVDAGLLPAGAGFEPEDRRGDRFPALPTCLAVETL